jgi:hypothetical protein
VHPAITKGSFKSGSIRPTAAFDLLMLTNLFATTDEGPDSFALGF